MRLGRVVGTLVATRKDAGLDGLPLRVVRDLVPSGGALVERDSFVVAVDAVGADEGQVVLTCAGSSARQTLQTKDRPVDTVIMAIVDAVDVGGRVHFDAGKA